SEATKPHIDRAAHRPEADPNRSRRDADRNPGRSPGVCWPNVQTGCSGGVVRMPARVYAQGSSTHRRCAMHAVLVKVSIDDAVDSVKELKETVVPRISRAPGFVAGYWTRSDDGSNGRSMLVFE